MGYFRLGYVRLDDCPAGLVPPTGARNRRKAAVKIRRGVVTKGTIPKLSVIT